MRQTFHDVWATSLWRALGIFLAGSVALAAATDARTDSRRHAAIQRSISLLESSARLWPAGCVSCHHHALELITVMAARRQHFVVDDAFLAIQQHALREALAQSSTRMMAAIDSAQSPAPSVGPNPAMIFGYSLFALAETHASRDASIDVSLSYLTRIQEPAGNWRSQAQRPPLEASDFAATALLVKAEQEYGSRDQRTVDVISAAARWLTRTAPEDTEDRTFRLLGSYWAGVPSERVADAAHDLLAEQRADGGWAQTRAGTSDAYATGEVLVALRTTRAVDSDRAFARGIAYLLRTQAGDGSWHVATRARPVQRYFDTGFPYAKDQFISYAATCWATLALLSDRASLVSAVD
jgi:hypothetical protein